MSQALILSYRLQKVINLYILHCLGNSNEFPISLPPDGL